MNKLANINNLQPIALRMRERQEQIQVEKTDVFGKLASLIILASEQGQDCLLVKTKLGKHLKWSDWLHAHVPQLSEADACKYERITTEQMIDPRQCVFAFLPAPERKQTECERTAPKPFELVWGYIGKLKSSIMQEPISTWPEQRILITRRELEPVARQLWPAVNFSGPSETFS